MSTVIEKISAFGIITVVVLEDAKMQRLWQKHWWKADFHVQK